MLLYDFRCVPCDSQFEIALSSMHDPVPACPRCGADSLAKIISAVRIGGIASAGPTRDQMPRTWQGASGGDRSVIDGWREAAVRREKLEERHPELAPDRRPVLAHEGQFAAKPLRAGDPWPQARTQASDA